MTIFIPIAGAAVVGFSVLYLQWRRGRGAGLFVLSTLPLGVLFLAGAVPVAAYRMLSGFQTMAQTGVGGVAEATELIASAVRPLLLGSTTLLLTTCAAAGFQALAVRPDPDPDATPTTNAAMHTSDVGTWTLMLSSTALIPSVVLAHVVLDTLRMVRFATRQLPPAGAGITEETVSQLSAAIAARVTSGVGLGVLLLLLVGGVAFANVVAARFARESPLARNVSRVAFALVVVSVVSLLFTMAAL